MATTSKLLTYEEWLRLPEVEGVEEVVNGEIRKIPPNKVLHADTVENLADLLKAQFDRRIVQVRVSTFGLVIRHDPLSQCSGAGRLHPFRSEVGGGSSFARKYASGAH